MKDQKWDARVREIDEELQRTDISDSRRLKNELELEELIDWRLKQHPESITDEELIRIVQAHAPEKLV